VQLFAFVASMAGFIPQPDCGPLPEAPATEPNVLSKEEAEQSWQLLFDGKSLKGWRGFQRKTIPKSWRVADGALTLTKGGSDRGDIRTLDAFDNFELRLQWAVSPGANSGILFFVRENVAENIWQTAPEMQVLDDARHEDGMQLSHRAGALYDLYAPKCNALKPAGEYNDVRLVVRNGHVEHWLNGYRVVEYDLDSADFRAHVAQSKFRDLPQFARVHSGYIGLQDHGDAVRYRSIRVRRL
jgi:3-keto-disaccharide hydrolase